MQRSIVYHWSQSNFFRKREPRTVRDEMIADTISRITREGEAGDARRIAEHRRADPGYHADGSFATMGDGCGWRKATTRD